MQTTMPQKHENQYQFMNRCKLSVIMNRDYPNEAQRVALCAKVWTEDRAK